MMLSSYLENDVELRAKRLRIGLILAVTFLPIFAILDFVVYRDAFSNMAFARVVSVAILVAFIPLAKNNRFISVKFLGVMWAVILFLSMDSLIIITEGVFSTYYGGLMLVIVALTVIMPWTIIETIMICVLMVTLYVVAVYIHAYTGLYQMNYIKLANSLFFLIGTSIICVTSSYYNCKLRFKEFCLNYELGLKNDELFEINKIRTEFFANISHEFRTPLTLILGPIKNVIDDHKSEFSSFAKENLDIAKENGFRLLKMVNDLLDVISLENGKTELKIERININEFIKSRVDSMSHMAALKNIQLDKNVCCEEIFIRADENALDKIVINLINNAIKFTQKDGLVEVLTRIYDKKLIIGVVDNGIGIKEENLDIIFDRFRQLDGSSTREFQGTGLGLALVKELTQAQGGVIVVDSKIGKGTAFSVLFDIDNDEGVNDAKSVSLEKSDNLSWIQRNINSSLGVASDEDEILENIRDVEPGVNKDVRVLVVDDEPDMLSFVAKTLNRFGYEVLIARDGEEAIKVAQKEKPDVIILDLMLPNIDGLSVCKTLKEDSNMEFTKIILLTARVDEKSKIQALKNGADDFMVKPFSKDELLLRISNLSKVKKLQSILHQDLVFSKDELKKSLEELRDFQEQLIQSEKLNSIGVLSSGIIHEVNNPLSYAMMALRFLKADSLIGKNEDLKEIVNDVETGMERINNIVGEFKDFVRLGEGGKKEEFLIIEAVKSALKFTIYDYKGIDVRNNIDPNIVVVGSNNHIIQIIINLISNACRAIGKNDDDRKGIIEIGSKILGTRVRIFVKDNGVGMNDEELGKVFESFYTTSDPGKGTGLGLSICNMMVQDHDGTLEVESEIGKGAMFSFDLQVGDGRGGCS